MTLAKSVQTLIRFTECSFEALERNSQLEVNESVTGSTSRSSWARCGAHSSRMKFARFANANDENIPRLIERRTARHVWP